MTHKFRLFTIDGKLPVGEEAFCAILNAAVETLVQEKFKDSKTNVRFELTPQFITEAYEKLKHMTIGDCSGQQLQEFLITAVLKRYWEIASPDKKYFLAFPPDTSIDSVIIETQEDGFKIDSDNLTATDQTSIYPFQIKEMREEDDIFAIAERGAQSGGEERLLDSEMFKQFMVRLQKKIIGSGAYKNTIPILFMRASSTSSFKVPEISLAFQETNQRYFKQMWLIAPFYGAKAEDGSTPPSPKPGLNFLVHDLLRPINDPADYEFTVLSIQCALKKVFVANSA